MIIYEKITIIIQIKKQCTILNQRKTEEKKMPSKEYEKEYDRISNILNDYCYKNDVKGLVSERKSS